MVKRLIIFIICFCVISGTSPYAGAVEHTEALRSDTAILVNGTRIPMRMYDIGGRLHVDLFEMALAFSGTESQFALRWSERNETVTLTTGRAFTAIGISSPQRIASKRPAVSTDVRFLIDGEALSVSAYNISNEIYFDLRMIAAALDFCIEWDPTGNILGIDTSRPYKESVIQRTVDPDKPMVALTFDDGPSEYTVPILDALEYYGAAATFYVTGNRVARNRVIIQRAFDGGSEIANHSWSHPRLDQSSEERVRNELRNTNNIIESVIGVAPNNMRPPYGAINSRVRSISEELGLSIIIWSVDPSDWRFRNADHIYQHVMERVMDRDIILLHDLYESTADAAVRLIPSLLAAGFQLVTVSELFYYSDIIPQPGVVYRSGLS